MSFSRRDLFWYCAGILSMLAVWLLVHALTGASNPPAPAAQVTPPINEPPGAVSDTPAALSAPSSQRAGSMDEMLERLEGRLATRGGSDSDWELLAQTYDFVGRGADAKLARSHQLPPSAASQTAPAPTQPGAGAASAAPSLSGNVELSDALKSKVAAGLTLFIVAKSVDSPGPPVAILRTTTGHWPLSFTLDDSNAMLPGRNLSSAAHVTIEARVSRSGMAAPQSGDFQSPLATIDPHAGKPLRIVIDHVIG